MSSPSGPAALRKPTAASDATKVNTSRLTKEQAEWGVGHPQQHVAVSKRSLNNGEEPKASDNDKPFPLLRFPLQRLLVPLLALVVFFPVVVDAAVALLMLLLRCCDAINAVAEAAEVVLLMASCCLSEPAFSS
jgi:hypothetical protein